MLETNHAGQGLEGASFVSKPELRVGIRALSDYRIAFNLIEKFYAEMDEFAVEPIQKHIFRHLDLLRLTYPDLQDLKGKRILDFACGSRVNANNAFHKFDPWMPRLLEELGAIPVGLDIAKQSGETFESYCVDLTRPGALSFLPTDSIDGYHINAFPTSGAIIAYQAEGLDWNTVKENLLIDLKRILKPDGKIIQGFTASCDNFVENFIRIGLRFANDDEL